MGDVFSGAYTDGDNSEVVATDTMKNFIHRESLAFRGSTLEGWLFFLGSRFLETYPQMERLRVSGEELRFDAQPVPAAGRWLRAQRHALPPAARRPRRRDAGAGSDRRRLGGADRPARGPGRPGAHQGHRLVLRGLRPRRVHDAARAPRPDAVHLHRHLLALRRPVHRGQPRSGALRRPGSRSRTWPRWCSTSS